MQPLPLIAITLGDPAGVGPEVIAKAFQEEGKFPACRAIVVGDAQFLRSTAAKTGIPLSVHSVASLAEAQFQPGVLDVLDLKNVPSGLVPGHASAQGGKASVDSIRTAVELALGHEVDAITTAPINKESLHLAGIHYPGHTELLADLTDTKEVALMLAGDRLRVVLVTTHVPVQQIHSLITPERVASTLRLTHGWLKKHVTAHPRIAVTGLNPHCGDGGIFGKEEETSILPAMETARAEEIQVDGPFSADAFFSRLKPNEYDAVVAMYHDQGMIPVKMESQGTAVNITLGLPILRTSVDHGTAYDIAGKGIASPDSLKTAIKKAAALCHPTLAAK